MHTNKKVVKIEDTGVAVSIYFDDGTQSEFDALIGADGVRGYSRKYILGSGHPALNTKLAGFWDCRALVPIQKAKEVLADKYFEEGRQHAWIGDGGFFMHDVLNSGATVQCVGSILTEEEWGSDEWKRNLDQEKLAQAFSSWENAPIVDGMVKLLGQNPDLHAYCMRDHSVPAPTYFKGRVCMIGDAAHCMMPWQGAGAGAGAALEDAMVLETLLKEVKEPAQIEHAFKAFNQVRRPRTQQMVESSAIMGLMFCGRGPAIGLDPDKLREGMASKWDFIYGLDMKEHKKEALKAFAALT